MATTNNPRNLYLSLLEQLMMLEEDRPAATGSAVQGNPAIHLVFPKSPRTSRSHLLPRLLADAEALSV
ncbi:hypothetical protein Nepgr_031504 [Nepenthes gracilis]|uniref:Uncharacterized protein n=1 Tax=Nepenthes gracilis TaxID=150966 RepID=A0AAD3TIN0_NEPGR|nr:hypothetical protein Nepgr_031504 [Nepenthes gracilis]